MISIRKRGNSYQYCFDIGTINGKRKQLTKCGFKTKNEALVAGQKAYNEFINGGISKESEMTYADYLDYWMEESFEKIKDELGRYRLCDLTPYILNQALLKLYQKFPTKDSLKNYQKVIKSSLRDATNYFGFIKGNPAGDMQIPRVLTFESKKTAENIFIP